METYLICKFSSTAAATFRQAVALIFDHVVRAESLPSGKFGSGGYISRASSVTGDVSRNINLSEYVICTAQLFFLHLFIAIRAFLFEVLVLTHARFVFHMHLYPLCSSD